MTVLPLIGLLIFVTVFALVMVRTLRKGRNAEHAAAALMPLTEERPVDHEASRAAQRRARAGNEVTL
jgi:cbb3-type cytochrome oxidase subunit 3